MRKCVEWAGITGKATYKKVNGGQGAIAIMNEEFVESFIRWALEYDLRAQECGRIIASSGTPILAITSKFNGDRLEYGPNDV